LEVTEAMRKQGITKSEMAKRMATSRSQLDRLLDPDNPRWHLYRSIVLMLIFALSMSEPEGLPLDTREEIILEARVAIKKAELLGENYQILKACRLHLENVESAMPLGRLPRTSEVFFGSLPNGQP